MNRDNDSIRHQKRTELNSLNVCKLAIWTKFPSASKGRPPIHGGNFTMSWSPMKYQRTEREVVLFFSSYGYTKGNPRKWPRKGGGCEGEKENQLFFMTWYGSKMTSNTSPAFIWTMIPRTHLLTAFSWCGICKTSTFHVYNRDNVPTLFPSEVQSTGKEKERERRTRNQSGRKKGSVNIKFLWDLKEQINEWMREWVKLFLLSFLDPSLPPFSPGVRILPTMLLSSCLWRDFIFILLQPNSQ